MCPSATFAPHAVEDEFPNRLYSTFALLPCLLAAIVDRFPAPRLKNNASISAPQRCVCAPASERTLVGPRAPAAGAEKKRPAAAIRESSKRQHDRELHIVELDGRGLRLRRDVAQGPRGKSAKPTAGAGLGSI